MGSVVCARREPLDELIASAQESAHDTSPAMNEVVRRFEGLVQGTAARLTADRALREDLANVGRLAVVAAVRRHRVGTPGFAAFAKRYVTGAARRELHRWMRQSPPSGNVVVAVDDEAEAAGLGKLAAAQPVPMDRTWGSIETTRAVAQLDARQATLLELRFFDDMTLATIAGEAGTSEAAVSQRLKVALREVRRALAA